MQLGAVGMGDIQVYSALNQPLKAQIPIKLNHPGERSGLLVTIARDQGFSDNALAPAPFDLTLILSEDASGNPIVLLSSQSPIVEPAFSIFLLLQTNDNRILREYTLLLDLPSPETNLSSVDTSLPSQSSDEASTGNEVVPTKSPKQLTQQNQFSSIPNDSNIYIPEKNETLWSIATKLKPNSQVSTHVMIKAIADTNPKAFNLGNINSLKSGFSLTVPSQTVTESISHKEAVAFIRTQNEEWQNRNNPPKETEVSSTTSEVEQVTLVEKSLNSVVAQQAEIDAEKEALLRRIALLESQLSMMEKLLDEAPSETNASELNQTPVSSLTESVIDSSPEQTLTTIEDETNAEALATTVTETEAVKGTESNVAKPEPAPSAPVKIATPAAASTTQQEPSLMEQLTSINGLMTLISENNFLIAMGAGLLLLIGIWITYRAKRNAEQMATHVVSSAPVTTSVQEVVEEPITVVDSVNVEDNDESDAIDRMVEIDVYMAYGRYKEAEALVNEGIAEEPSDPEYYLKLFEVYKATENKTGFEAEAESFFSGVGAEHPDAWEKVVVMGKEVCPNHPLFVDLSSPEDEPVSENDTENDMENFIENSTHEVEPNETADTNPVEVNPDAVDMNLSDESELSGETSEDTNVSVDAELAQPEEISGEELSSDLPEEVSAEHEIDLSLGESSIEDELSNMEEELAKREETVQHEETNSAAEVISENNPESIDRNPSITDDHLIESAAEEFLENDISNFLDDENLIDSDPMAELNDTAAALEEIENQGEDFAGEMTFDREAVETKLDLVRAYIEMEDQDEARRILDEILAEGNDEQKTQAEELIKQIA